MGIFEQLPELLLPWYHAYKRDLPWRKDKDPYHIWVSEIMLQQTRVEAVKNYYLRFIAALPDVCALANVNDDQLNKLWEGLGYYSRARNLKKAAQKIMTDYNGIFPREYDDVISLPGIGEYTAGAVCSIAYDLPVPAVDGNVLRIAARLLNDDTSVDLPAFKSKIRSQLKDVYPEEAGAFTQALMELGATVCGPNRKADCKMCPCCDVCLAQLKGTVDSLPVRSPKREKRKEALTVFILQCGDKYAIEKRPGKGLLAGLWQFPNVPGKLAPQEALDRLEEYGLRPETKLKTVEREHVFTHIVWQMHGVYVKVKEIFGGFSWLTGEQIDAEAALPTAFRQFWNIREVNENE
ncbi:MAG: A/G-specific adenine glycosylase [Oscillospiraceae bacterium]|nr:A/G-specific adenine glycosylase [Oscillospiraceae bacterium]